MYAWQGILVNAILILREYKLNPFKFTRDRVFLGQVICI